jgi:dipeptidyl-peptidase-4
MNFKTFFSWAFFVISLSVCSQNSLKSISLEDIWQKGTFRTERMNELNPMNGDFYTLLNANRVSGTTSVDKYAYATLEKVETIVDSKDLKGLTYFESYIFSSDETKLLLKTESEPIYRHSEFADFFVYDIATKSLLKIADAKVQEATLSPDNQKVAYVYQNNIYIQNLLDGKIIQITQDGEKNKIINGITDWVYEEELGFVRAFEWNADGTSLAFLRFDETEVPEYTMAHYGDELYPETITFKYPKAGEKNSIVTLHLYDLTTQKTEKIELGAYEYIAKIQWTNDKELLTAQTLNRRQDDLKLIQINRKSLQTKLLLNEKSDTYINVRDYFTFLKDNSFIMSSERDGWEHLYLYNADGSLKNQITKGEFDVLNFFGVDETTQKIFYQSTENGSINKTVYSIGLNGKNKKLLSRDNGTNSASFSKNKKFFINNFSDAKTPPIFTLHNQEGKLLKEIKDNNKLSDKLKGYYAIPKEFSTLTTPNGTFNMWMMKPKNFDASKKYPVLMYQYSGPGSQSVENTWNAYDEYWYAMLAEKGYIIACVDGRGTGGKGTAFTKVTYKELGKYETIDQIESAIEIGKLPYVDASRIGIWGWSYGGFTSSNALLKGGDVFKMAIAVAPVTSWRYYDSIYTERYLQTPQENPTGYDQNSPLFFANQLKGKYLLVHGTGDDNVHVQNSMQMINALIDADKQFDSEFYPDSNHGIYQRQNSRLQLYKRMTAFILENL